MASARDLRKRITSVKSTQQITKAMKMVAAAKLRRSQEAVVSIRPYANELNKMIVKVAESLGDELSHPLLTRKENAEKVLLVVVTSDRGLCGAFNGSVIKAAVRFQKTNAHKYKKLDLAFIGKKGYEFFKAKYNGKYYQDMFVKMNFKKAADLARELSELFISGEYDEIKLVYNEFKSAISQKVNLESFLPLAQSFGEAPPTEFGLTIYEPSAQGIMNHLLPKHFAIQVYRMLLESLASEHAARMTAMENATKNAGEMIKKLTLAYNKTRQAGITKELLEITSGSEAQK